MTIEELNSLKPGDCLADNRGIYKIHLITKHHIQYYYCKCFSDGIAWGNTCTLKSWFLEHENLHKVDSNSYDKACKLANVTYNSIKSLIL